MKSLSEVLAQRTTLNESQKADQSTVTITKPRLRKEDYLGIGKVLKTAVNQQLITPDEAQTYVNTLAYIDYMKGLRIR